MTRLRAVWFGSKFSWRIAASTAARVSSRTLSPSLITRDTVMRDTPAIWATSAMVAPRT